MVRMIDGSLQPERMLRGLVIALAVLATAIPAHSMVATRLYWTSLGEQKVRRAGLDGSPIQDLAVGNDVRGIALDLISNKVYWTSTFAIHRANFDGSNPEAIVTSGVFAPEFIALDLTAGKMYVANFGKIDRFNLDGSGQQTVFNSGVANLVGPVLDAGTGKMYWLITEPGFQKIQRANLDGSSVEDIVTGGFTFPFGGLALDTAHGKLYWTDSGMSAIRRANLDGSGVETVLQAGGGLTGIAVDPWGGKVYWINAQFSNIQRANLDGTGVEFVRFGIGSNPRHIAIEFEQVPITVVADAGPDQTVNEGVGVSLNGAGSSGQNLLFSWEQLAGPTVALAGATTATPTFTVPLLPGGFGSQVLTFQLTVSSGGQSSTDSVDVTVVNVNHAPVVEAGGDQVVNEGSAVTLSGDASFDPDNDPLAFQWVQTGGPEVALTGANGASPTFTAPLLGGGVGGPEVLTFELTVSDGALTHTDSVVVTVEQVNHPPTADAGSPQTVHSGTVVTLNGSGSGDPDGDPISFSWAQVGSGTGVSLGNATTATPSFTAPPLSGSETLTFQLTVSDGLLAGVAEVAVTVSNGAPRCDLGLASPGLLWPPNHGMRAIAITNVTDPDDTSVTITVTGVTQDEPVDGLGDGDTSPDAVPQGAGMLLRAERAGTGNGRVYRVTFSADDGLGGTCAGTVDVTVPKSMKPGQGAVDDGQAYDSTLP